MAKKAKKKAERTKKPRRPPPCYCGTEHCGCCGSVLHADKNPPYCNPSLLDDRWVCLECSKSLAEAARW